MKWYIWDLLQNNWGVRWEGVRQRQNNIGHEAGWWIRKSNILSTHTFLCSEFSIMKSLKMEIATKKHRQKKGVLLGALG